MKTVKNYLGVLMLVILVGGIAANVQAQGRGHGKSNSNSGKSHDKENRSGKGHDKHRENDRSDRDHKDSHHDYARNDRDRSDSHRDYTRNNSRDSHHSYARNDQYYHGRYVTYNYHRHSSPSWAPAYGYRYNTRYIYYSDYNVYYDCHRDVFVIWTGRNWMISTRIPDAICHVDFNRTVVVGVDYWDDDFDFYLAKQRPAYVNIRASW